MMKPYDTTPPLVRYLQEQLGSYSWHEPPFGKGTIARALLRDDADEHRVIEITVGEIHERFAFDVCYYSAYLQEECISIRLTPILNYISLPEILAALAFDPVEYRDAQMAAAMDAIKLHALRYEV